MRLQAWELEKLEVSWEGTRPGWKTLSVGLPASCKAGKGCWPCSLRKLAGQVTGANSGFPDSKALRRDREKRREKSIEMVKGMRIWKKRGEGFLGFTNWMS